MEIWKDVIGFEGYYEVSSLGRVRRKKTETVYKDGRIAHFSQTILKQSKNKKGYRIVYLSKASKQTTLTVHRIVAKAFVDNPENKKTVNHKDLNKENNTVDNLEWMTNKENMRHAFENGVYKERDKTTIKNLKHYSGGVKGSVNPTAILTERDVIKMREMRSSGCKLKEIASVFNVAECTVSAICLRKTWTHV